MASRAQVSNPQDLSIRSGWWSENLLAGTDLSGFHGWTFISAGSQGCLGDSACSAVAGGYTRPSQLRLSLLLSQSTQPYQDSPHPLPAVASSQLWVFCPVSLKPLMPAPELGRVTSASQTTKASPGRTDFHEGSCYTLVLCTDVKLDFRAPNAGCAIQASWVWGRVSAKRVLTAHPSLQVSHYPLPLVLREETEGQSREPILVKVSPPWVSWVCFRQ